MQSGERLLEVIRDQVDTSGMDEHHRSRAGWEKDVPHHQLPRGAFMSLPQKHSQKQ